MSQVILQALYILSFLMAGLATYLWSMALFGYRLQIKRLSVFFALRILQYGIILLFGKNSAVGFVIPFIIIILDCALALGMRGVRLLTGAALLILSVFLAELLTSPALFWFFTAEQIQLAKDTLTPATVTIAMLSGLSVNLLALCALAARRTWEVKRPGTHPQWLYLMRPLALLLLALGTIAITLRRVAQLNPAQQLMEINFCYLAIAFLLVLSSTYISQDLKYLQIARSNEKLLRQQRIYDTLLTETRAFRHNIANMLYGLEGVLMHGDVERIRAYYAQMRNQCARINNENITALERIPSPAVSALLLQKLQRAKELDVLIYLNVEQDMTWRGIRDADMCQLLGILTDNAIEAAQRAPAKFVQATFGKTGDAMEVIIRNTYDTQGVDMGFLLGEPASAREGHEGLGLKSAREIIARQRRVVMNQFPRGRYIETLLLFF